MAPSAAMGPKMTPVVNSVPNPMTTPAKANSRTGVNMAPPNFWIFSIISGTPFLVCRAMSFTGGPRAAASHGPRGATGHYLFVQDRHSWCPNLFV